jgi:hypothetical protein
MLFYLFKRYKFISSLKFKKVEKLYWNEECRFSLDPAFPSHVRVTDPALIKGEETIACSNGIAKKAENFMKALPTYIKHLGGGITYRK